MWLFRKKKTYLVKWAYEPGDRHYNDLVRACDEIGAWRKIKSEHAISITLLDIKEV